MEKNNFRGGYSSQDQIPILGREFSRKWYEERTRVYIWALLTWKRLSTKYPSENW